MTCWSCWWRKTKQSVKDKDKAKFIETHNPLHTVTQCSTFEILNPDVRDFRLCTSRIIAYIVCITDVKDDTDCTDAALCWASVANCFFSILFFTSNLKLIPIIRTIFIVHDADNHLIRIIHTIRLIRDAD
jgi:hypothetical protein